MGRFDFGPTSARGLANNGVARPGLVDDSYRSPGCQLVARHKGWWRSQDDPSQPEDHRSLLVIGTVPGRGRGQDYLTLSSGSAGQLAPLLADRGTQPALPTPRWSETLYLPRAVPVDILVT